MAFFPSLEDNYTPIPKAFMQKLFNEPMSRPEIIVMLLLFQRTYGWKKERAFLQLSTIVQETHLSEEEALDGIEIALDRGAILSLPLGEGEDSRAYLLNTPENAQFLSLYGDEQTDGPGTPPEDDDAPRTVHTPLAEAFPEQGGSLFASGTDDYPDPPFGGNSETDVIPISFTDEPELFQAPGETNMAPPSSAPAPSPTPSSSTVGDGDTPASPPPAYLDLPFRKQTVAMLTRILGRWPTKTEAARLAELQAGDEDLIEAMSSLLAKTNDIYSSDLIVYEFESLLSQRKRLQRDSKAQERREALQDKQRSCPRCSGLGYLFIGVNEIRECSCRKVADD